LSAAKALLVVVISITFWSKSKLSTPFHPEALCPQVITLPSFLSAANALSFEYIRLTSLVRDDDTLLEFHPLFPQVTTLPSFFNAATADNV